MSRNLRSITQTRTKEDVIEFVELAIEEQSLDGVAHRVLPQTLNIHPKFNPEILRLVHEQEAFNMNGDRIQVTGISSVDFHSLVAAEIKKVDATFSYEQKLCDHNQTKEIHSAALNWLSENA